MLVFFKNALFVGQLGSGPRLLTDNADVVPTDRVNRPTGPM